MNMDLLRVIVFWALVIVTSIGVFVLYRIMLNGTADYLQGVSVHDLLSEAMSRIGALCFLLGAEVVGAVYYTYQYF